MAMKSEKKPGGTLPTNMEDLTPSSNITYNNEVVAIIAGLAANEVEGIAGMCTVSGSIMSKNRNVTKGVKVEVGTEEVAVDLYVIVEYGIPIQRAAADAQENVRKAIESMTGPCRPAHSRPLSPPVRLWNPIRCACPKRRKKRLRSLNPSFPLNR